jgi:precorrin-4/cobalt-precorrin-4 C11-methyltransferase
MRVYVIGAGPGDPKLLTLRGAELVARCPVVLYTGSLVPREVLATARPGARVLDSSSMTLEQIVEVLVAARDADEDVARVHTGDPSLFGSTAEQLRRMDELGIPWEIVPGVSSFTAAAAVLGKELTLPELSQTVILTRAEGRTPVPPRERLEALAAHQATLALFLSVNLLEDVTRALIPAYGADCPIAVVHKATCPDQAIVTGTLEDIRAKVRAAGIRSQSMILVGRVLTSTDFANSRLYAADFTHRFRKGQKTSARTPAPTPASTPDPAPTAEPKDTTKRARKGQLLVYTGHGKGKTTAALGLVFRALGRGLRVLVVQFIKGKWKTGERLFAENIPGLTFLVMGRGFTWESDDISRDRRAAREAWSTARGSILKGDHDVVVLDELTYAINYGFLELGEVLAAFRDRPEPVHVVVTGRNAPNELVELADLVTDMRPVKHPFERGIPAQPGIDF